MSVRFNGSGDNLAVAASLALTTGAFSFGGWAKLISDRNVFSDLFGAVDTPASPTDYLLALCDSTGNNAAGYSTSGNTGATALTVGTWYYIVIDRTGTTFRIRIFDDSTSTTPVGSGTITDSRNYTALDNFIIGEASTGEWPDAEIACVRAHIGVSWTDAQCRTESQKLTPQTGGGTIYGNWKLETTGADANGINDSGGGAHHLTNTGCVNGASRPTQLESAGSTQTLTASVTPSATLVNVPLQTLAASVTPTAAITQLPKQTLTASVTPTATLSSTAGGAGTQTLTASVAPTANLVNVPLQALTASVAPSAAITQQAQHILTASVTPSATSSALIYVDGLSAVVTPTATLSNQATITQSLGAAFTPSATLVNLLIQPLAASVTPSASLVNKPLQSLAASFTPAATLNNGGAASQSLTANVTPTANLVNLPQQTLSALLPISALMFGNPGPLLPTGNTFGAGGERRAHRRG